MHDLVDYYRRLSGYSYLEPVETRVRVVRPPERAPFIHLNVEACLRAVPLSLEECRARIEREWEGRRIASVLGILQVCLLGCKPFRGLTEYEIKDVRRGVPRKRQIHDCPHRPELLESLALGLWVHESALSTDTWSGFVAERDLALAFLPVAESILVQLRRRGIPLADPTLRHRSTASLIRTLRQAADIMSGIQPADEVHAGGMMPGTSHPLAHVNTYLLVQNMAENFRLRAPSTFPEEAIYHTVADILKPLGVRNNRGKPFTPAGIKALLRRRSRP